MDRQPRILVLIKHYEPAYKFGGPITSIRNLINALEPDYKFYIVCLDRDFREHSRLEGITEGKWVRRNGAHICHLDVSLARPHKLVRAIRAIDCDLVYLNSFFEPLFSTLPAALMKARVLPHRPVLIAPRGELSPGALSIKARKKKAFLKAQAFFGLYSNAWWQATSEAERDEIIATLGYNTRVQVVPNLPTLSWNERWERRQKQPGMASIVFVSRISPKKNLMAAIQALKAVRGTVEFDIWGTIDDAQYWADCKAALKQLPSTVIAHYRGVAKPVDVPRIFQSTHALVLPTLGENFGHVICESLAAGCPVIISDRTPWKDLAVAEVGFDIPVHDLAGLTAAIQTFVDMDGEAYMPRARRCTAFATRQSSLVAATAASRAMFDRVLEHRSESRLHARESQV